jgi:hypothetical protein
MEYKEGYSGCENHSMSYVSRKTGCGAQQGWGYLHPFEDEKCNLDLLKWPRPSTRKLDNAVDGTNENCGCGEPQRWKAVS